MSDSTLPFYRAAVLGVLGRLSFKHFQPPLWKRWCQSVALASLSPECLEDRLGLFVSSCYDDLSRMLLSRGGMFPLLLSSWVQRRDSKENTQLLLSFLKLARRFSPDFSALEWLTLLRDYDYRALVLRLYRYSKVPTELRRCPRVGQPPPSWVKRGSGFHHLFSEYDLLYGLPWKANDPYGESFPQPSYSLASPPNSPPASPMEQ